MPLYRATSIRGIKRKESETVKMDPMSKMLGKLNLMKEGKKRVVAIKDDDIDKANRDLQNAVVGKLLFGKQINWEIFKGTMPKELEVGRTSFV